MPSPVNSRRSLATAKAVASVQSLIITLRRSAPDAAADY